MWLYHRVMSPNNAVSSGVSLSVPLLFTYDIQNTFLMAQLKSFQILVLADKRKQWSKQFYWNPPNIGQKMPALLERPKMTKTMYQALKRHIMRERERKKQGNNLNLLSERWFCVFGQACLSKQCRLIDWGCSLIKVYTVCLLSCFFWRHYCIRIQLRVHCSNFMIITAIFWLSKFFELRYSDLSCLVKKPTKWHVHPAKTQISLGIRPVWSESSLSAWRKLWSLASHWAHSKDSDQTGRMPRLIWGFAGRIYHFVGFCHEASHLFVVPITSKAKRSSLRGRLCSS